VESSFSQPRLSDNRASGVSNHPSPYNDLSTGDIFLSKALQQFQEHMPLGLCVKFGGTLNKIPWPESASELYRPSYCSFSTKLVPTFADRGFHVINVTDPLRPYSRFSRPGPLLLLPSSPSVVLTTLSGPRSRLLRKSSSVGNRTRTSGSVATNSDH
jgi:hypothetical protein